MNIKPTLQNLATREELNPRMTAPPQQVIDAAWGEESESRLDAFREGKLTARSFDNVINDMNAGSRADRASE